MKTPTIDTAYFDCFSGAAGDMIVGALIDAGADENALRATLARLPIDGYDLDIRKVKRQGIAATRFEVTLHDAKQPHRGLSTIRRIIEESDLPAEVKRGAVDVFKRLAVAEAAVHGTTVDEVHFHEVGAVDAIVDIVGAVAALRQLGVNRVICSPIPPGSGTVKCHHGVMPVPAPATARLLEGVPLGTAPNSGELTTPTGAALLTTMARSYGPLTGMEIAAVGYGAGSREGEVMPNLLRVILGRGAETSARESLAVLETNIDDATPEVVGHCMERLLDAGALDVYAQPIQMKKSRSAIMLSVLCRWDAVAALESLIFRETPTFGIRRYGVERAAMERTEQSVDTPFGPIRIKVGTYGDVETAAPEFEDCRAAAANHGVALREVMAAAQAAWTTSRRSG